MKINLNAASAFAVFIALGVAATVLPAAAQSTGSSLTRQDEEAFPSTGLGATTIGERVLILPDGTWKIDKYFHADEFQAVTDHGRTIVLRQVKDPNTGEVTRRWEYDSRQGGPLQIVVSRAITTDRSLHSTNDNCIPVITVRNLTNLSMFRMVAELQFISQSGVRSSTSILAGPLDDGEQGDFLSGPLFLDTCTGLKAELHIPYCRFENGIDCSRVVTASEFGTIPTILFEPENAAANAKSN